MYLNFPSQFLLIQYLERLNRQKAVEKWVDNWVRNIKWQMLEVLVDIYNTRLLTEDTRKIDAGATAQWKSDFKRTLVSLRSEAKAHTALVLLAIADLPNDHQIAYRLLTKSVSIDNVEYILEKLETSVREHRNFSLSRVGHSQIERGIAMVRKRTFRLDGQMQVMTLTEQAI